MYTSQTRQTMPAGSVSPHVEVHVAERQYSVLVVDDNDCLRTTLTLLLETLGYNAENRSDGWDGLRWLEGHPRVDLVLLDQTMPGMTGVQMLQRLRQTRPLLPVLFISGDLDSIPHSITSADSRVGVLAKPFTLAALTQAMETLLGAAQPTGQSEAIPAPCL